MYLLLQVRDEFICAWCRHWGTRRSVVALGEEPVSLNDNRDANIGTKLSPGYGHLPNIFEVHRIVCPNVTLCPNSSLCKVLCRFCPSLVASLDVNIS